MKLRLTFFVLTTNDSGIVDHMYIPMRAGFGGGSYNYAIGIGNVALRRRH